MALKYKAQRYFPPYSGKCTGCQEVKSGRDGESDVGRAPVTDPEGRRLVVGRKVRREMREREGRINVKLQGSQERLPVMKFGVRKGKSG